MNQMILLLGGPGHGRIARGSHWEAGDVLFVPEFPPVHFGLSDFEDMFVEPIKHHYTVANFATSGDDWVRRQMMRIAVREEDSHPEQVRALLLSYFMEKWNERGTTR